MSHLGISFSTLAWITGAVLVDGAVGLSGGILPTAFIQKRMAELLSFASGTLMAAALLDMLPEALDGAYQHLFHPILSGSAAQDVLLSVMIGFITFYVVESFLGSHAAGQSGHKHDTVGPLILIGDAIHNTGDGVAIAAAFLVDVRIGVGTAIAVIVHEVPQEVGDFAILVSHGYSKMKALWYLTLVQMSALLGAIGAIVAWRLTASASIYLMALSAGGFIYIAAADLLPELHRRKPGAPIQKLLCFTLGVALIVLTRRFFQQG